MSNRYICVSRLSAHTWWRHHLDNDVDRCKVYFTENNNSGLFVVSSQLTLFFFLTPMKMFNFPQLLVCLGGIILTTLINVLYIRSKKWLYVVQSQYRYSQNSHTHINIMNHESNRTKFGSFACKIAFISFRLYLHIGDKLFAWVTLKKISFYLHKIDRRKYSIREMYVYLEG